MLVRYTGGTACRARKDNGMRAFRSALSKVVLQPSKIATRSSRQNSRMSVGSSTNSP